MNDVNDGSRSDLLNIFYVSSCITPEHKDQFKFRSQINPKVEPVCIWTVDAFGGEVVELLEVGIHHDLLLVGVLERLTPGVHRQIIHVSSQDRFLCIIQKQKYKYKNNPGELS